MQGTPGTGKQHKPGVPILEHRLGFVTVKISPSCPPRQHRAESRGKPGSGRLPWGSVPQTLPRRVWGHWGHLEQPAVAVPGGLAQGLGELPEPRGLGMLRGAEAASVHLAWK